MKNKKLNVDCVEAVENAEVSIDTEQTLKMQKEIQLFAKKKITNFIILALGIVLMLTQWIAGLNIVTLVNAIFLCVVSAVIAVKLIFYRRIDLWDIIGYAASLFGVISFYIVAGADAGWGAITSALPGYSSSAHPLWQGVGNFGTRLAGNLLIASPMILLLAGLFCCAKFIKVAKVKAATSYALSVLLIASSIIFVFTMNLRSNPKVFNMIQGQIDYLNNVAEKKANSPNVLVIMMDDLGYGDTSYNARKIGVTPAFETENIDSIAENGIDFENFYSAYSVCSPARFSLMTGRYPYRGYADNVIYPTVNSFSPFASTRVFNSIEMGNNVDGLLGDEITFAETFQQAGYNTGLFGKWHLGDYGEYLPTNQGFDYFYGSHHVNDMNPFYHVRESAGEYEIAVGAKEMNQANATKLIHNEIYSYIENNADNNESFMAVYTTPWPHAPLYAGDEFRGKSGAGIYGDCIIEFDDYLGKLFDMMEQKGIMDDTIIMFTSDNGPALNGSANELRGGKYSAYEAGQKVPFYLKYGDNYIPAGQTNRTIKQSATLVDIYPTLVEMCGITNKDGKANYLPSDVDRVIDGVSMMKLINDSTGNEFIHGRDNPILHMKREKINAIQYTMTKDDVLASVAGYTTGDNSVGTGNLEDYEKLDLIEKNDTLTFKFFKKMKNDNPEFFNMKRRNWLICLTDDTSESYQRAGVFPDIAKQLEEDMANQMKAFKENRRGVNKEYYKK